jgi:hypothetical protein
MKGGLKDPCADAGEAVPLTDDFRRLVSSGRPAPAVVKFEIPKERHADQGDGVSGPPVSS